MYTALIIGIAGLLIWYSCTRLELRGEGSDTFFAREHQARDGMSRAERASQRQEKASAHRLVRFFKSIGIGLAVIGFGGGAVIYALAG